MPPPDPSAHQARTKIEAALGQIGFCLPGTVTIRQALCGKPRCACAADPPSLHGPLHPVNPHRQGQDRHPAAHPGPVPGLRALVRQPRRLRALAAELEALSGDQPT
jgi:hypothetical protein